MSIIFASSTINMKNWTKYYLNAQVADYWHVDDQCQAVIFQYWLFWISLYNPCTSLHFKLSFKLFVDCTSFQIVIFAGHNTVEGEDSLSFLQTLLSLPPQQQIWVSRSQLSKTKWCIAKALDISHTEFAREAWLNLYQHLTHPRTSVNSAYIPIHKPTKMEWK
jgi:hypothetical protein